MQNLSDEDIDKLFKRAAEQQQTQFDPADWDNMAKRLDASKKPWLNYYTWTGSLVLVGVVVWLGWFFSTPSALVASENNLSVLQKEAPVKQGKSLGETNNTLSAVKTLPLVSVKEANETTTSSSHQSTAAYTSVKSGTKKTNRIAKKNSQTKSSTRHSSSVTHAAIATPSQLLAPPVSSDQSNQNEVTKVSSEGESEIVNRSSLSNIDLDVNSKSDSNGDLDQTEISSNVESLGLASLLTKEATEVKSQLDVELNAVLDQNNVEQKSIGNQTISKIRIDSVEKVTTKEEDVEKDDVSIETTNEAIEEQTFSRFAIKATVAPDFSSEQFKSIDKMGFNYGLMVEYFLNKNISITTGALWSRKYYSAEEVDYNGYHADRAYGDCRMWDIPLNVNYYFSPAKRFSFFASAGLSSYLMNEENYDYEVDTNYGTKTYTSQVIKENKEWFKTLNVSIGLQKQITSHVAIQVEPFVKVPLAGVGEGNISLASFGGFFSVRYNFLTLKK